VARSLWLFLFAANIYAQSGCSNAQVWTPCDLTFDLQPGEDPARADLSAQFQSPKHNTYLIHAFHASPSQLVLRFAATEEGTWHYLLQSTLTRLQGQQLQLTVADANAPGYVQAANVHHFKTSNGQPHLWMATAIDRFTDIPRSEFDKQLAARADEKFTHLRVTLDPKADLVEAAERVRAIHSRGIVSDIVFNSLPEDHAARERFVSDAVARLGAFNVTWCGAPALEDIPHARSALRELGLLLIKYDGYDHPRTTLAKSTSGPFLGDGWMNLAAYGTADPNIGAVEHQLYQTPAICTGIRTRQDLWNATMNGQYPASGSGQFMKAWAEFMADNRYWELEPYFDVDGGRAIALEGIMPDDDEPSGIEYIVYIEKPGPIEVGVIKHRYDVSWMDPATGEVIKGKEFSGTRFTGVAPDSSHDWVLHISREGTKKSMLKSVRFTSREIPVQVVEMDPKKTPFDVGQPSGSDLSLSIPGFYELKITRPARATRLLLLEWTGEVTADGEGYRVIGAGEHGTLQVPSGLAKQYPALLNIHVNVMNAFGKVYGLDKVYTLRP